MIKVMSNNKIYKDYDIDLKQETNEVIGKVIGYDRTIG